MGRPAPQSDRQANQKAEPFKLTFRHNEIRTLICVAATGTAMSNLQWMNTQLIDIIVMVVALTYTIGAYFFLRSRPTEKQAFFFDRVTTLDAAVIGFILSFVQFTVLPTFLFITMIQFNSLINGGIPKWVKDNTAFIFGVALTFLFWEPQWTFESSLNLGVASLIGIFTYFCAYAFFLNIRIQRLEMDNKKLTNEQTQYKLRTYKLSRYLTPTVWKSVNEGRDESLMTSRKRVTVFFSDIQGFSSLSEELESETITDLLNNYLTEMTKIVAKHKGTIDKFMGDGLMVIFGDTQSQGFKMDCIRCVSMAIDMRKKMKELQTKWYNQGIKKPLRIRMGINTGYCTVGTFGTSHYMEYTVLGTHVNLASRLESAAEAGEILISHETWSLIKEVIMCRDKGEITVKGFTHPVKVYQVVDFRKDLGKNQSYYEENAEGFSIHMDLEKIRNYDKNRVIEALERVTQRLKDKVF
ncbi:Adenylate cyclase 1 [Thalassocella blandensis]|nr:Adenylate cyclase 1 [Thalassocella blandensis]